MDIDVFDYNLPETLIAKTPSQERTQSKMMCLNRQTGDITHQHFFDLPQWLHPNDLLVLNNTQVIPARLYGFKETGGKIELLIERIQTETSAIAFIKSNAKVQLNTVIHFESGSTAKIIKRIDHLFVLHFSTHIDTLLDMEGHVPLPPYIKREDSIDDFSRYQTVFAKHRGAVAAPTAGLHFDNTLLNQLQSMGVQTTEITLHVGAGTFSPLRDEHLETKTLHHEQLVVSAETCEAIESTKAKGGRVIAVGTTSVRALESAALNKTLQPFQGETNLFIMPGDTFNVVDAMITNFHLPKSSLMMLVSAFAGLDHTLDAYNTAIENNYRFYSYGDAMFIY